MNWNECRCNMTSREGQVCIMKFDIEHWAASRNMSCVYSGKNKMHWTNDFFYIEATYISSST